MLLLGFEMLSGLSINFKKIIYVPNGHGSGGSTSSNPHLALQSRLIPIQLLGSSKQANFPSCHDFLPDKFGRKLATWKGSFLLGEVG